MTAMELVRAGRRALGPMGRNFPLLVDGGAAFSAFLHGPGVSIITYRRVRLRDREFCVNSLAFEDASAASASRVTLSLLIRKPAGFFLRPIPHASAYASTPLLTGSRCMSTNRASNNGRWYDDSRMFLLQMYLYFNDLVTRNHAATVMSVEKVRTEIMADVYKFFQDTTWRWIGILTASLSGTVTLSYILFEKRASMTEENLEKKQEHVEKRQEHLEKRQDAQDREMKLLKVQLGMYMAGNNNLDDSFSALHADHVGVGSLILINDSACKVIQVVPENDDTIRFICNDFFTGKRLELMIPCEYYLKMPHVTSERCIVLSVSSESHSITVRSEVSHKKKDIKAEPDMIAKIQNMKSSRAFVTITSCIGREIVTDAWEEPNTWSWFGMFKRG
ncbi:hypothetical protein EJB05_39120 [Eragrostis curvula]|uniref:Uncharacterized protein n=1 Tax=Eragrostis curvula TaxID=38414 RepID=A0A5J9TW18_9POAL|nr:hypothetical protein EJB05_39120 [Eragrostis curvula]